MTAGGKIPQVFVEKYERLRSIQGDPAYAPEARQHTAKLFFFVESRIRQVRRRTDPRAKSHVTLDFEPRILAALVSFMAENCRVSDRPEAISMILNSALKAQGFLKSGARSSRANAPVARYHR